MPSKTKERRRGGFLLDSSFIPSQISPSIFLHFHFQFPRIRLFNSNSPPQSPTTFPQKMPSFSMISLPESPAFFRRPSSQSQMAQPNPNPLNPHQSHPHHHQRHSHTNSQTNSHGLPLLRASFRKALQKAVRLRRQHRRRMVSVRSATWAILLLQLVLSCTAIVASVAVVCAQSQSVSAAGAPLGPTPVMLFVCVLSFALLTASVLGMFGLQGRNPPLLIPVIFVSSVVAIFHSVVLVQWFNEWWSRPAQGEQVDPDWFITFSGSVAFQLAFLLDANANAANTNANCPPPPPPSFVHFEPSIPSSPSPNRQRLLLLLLLAIQLILALAQFAHNGLTLLSNQANSYKHQESRLTMQATLLLNLFWAISVCIALVGLFHRLSALLLPHFCLSLLLLPFHCLLLVILQGPISVERISAGLAICALAGAAILEWKRMGKDGQEEDGIMLNSSSRKEP